MALLAEQKRKVKYGLDPQNTNWSNDTSKFGQRLMEKMGWEKGKGLGANEDGMTEHIKASYKSDTRGVGCTPQTADAWIAHQDDFNDLLKMLNSQNEASGQEEKTEIDGHKRYYGRFARGQVPTLRSTDDLDCIFGRRKTKSKISKSKNGSDLNSDCIEANEESRDGLTTVTSTSSVQEYFAKKMAEMKTRKSALLADNEASEKKETDYNSEHTKENKTSLYGAVNFLYHEEVADVNHETDNRTTDEQTSRGWYQNGMEDNDNKSQNVHIKEKSSKKKRRKEKDDNGDFKCDTEIKADKKKKKKKDKHKTLEESVAIMNDNAATDSLATLSKAEKHKLFKKTKKKEKNMESELKSAGDSQICTVVDNEGRKKEKKQKRKKRKRSYNEDIVPEIVDTDTTSTGEISRNIKKRKLENGNDEIGSYSKAHSTKGHVTDNTETESHVVMENSAHKKKKKKQKRKHNHTGTDEDSESTMGIVSSSDGKEVKPKKEKKRGKDTKANEAEGDATGSIHNLKQNDHIVSEEHDINKDVPESSSIKNASPTANVSKLDRKLKKKEGAKGRQIKKADSNALFPGSNVADIVGYGFNKSLAGNHVKVK